MNNRLMIAIFSLSLIINMVSLEALGEGPNDNDITNLYYNILIGELFPSGNVYLERFSLPCQDALLYKVEKKRTDTPMTVVSINNYEIEKMIYFGGSDIREYSHIEYEAAMKHVRDDHERKDKYGSTLSNITKANTILNARKIALFHIKSINYNILLSVYNTHGIEYASTVYVIDLIKNGKIIFTKEKYNTDGPY